MRNKYYFNLNALFLFLPPLKILENMLACEDLWSPFEDTWSNRRDHLLCKEKWIDWSINYLT